MLFLDRVTDFLITDGLYDGGLDAFSPVAFRTLADEPVTSLHLVSERKHSTPLWYSSFTIPVATFQPGQIWYSNSAASPDQVVDAPSAVITGTAGDDVIEGTTDADNIDGKAGNDIIDGRNGADIIHGGPGNDTITDTKGEDTIYGDDGNDIFIIRVRDFADASYGTIYGGDGNDRVTFTKTSYSTGYNMDLGSGDDYLEVRALSGRTDVSLGLGVDTIFFHPQLGNNSYNYLRISDFETGENGDRLDFISWLNSHLLNWTIGDNPFQTGHLELWQEGTSVRLLIHRDGSGGGDGSGMPLAEFYNAQVSDFTAANFSGFNPSEPPNNAFNVTSDYTVEIGEEIFRLNATPSNFNRVTILYSDQANNAIFTNNGTVSAIADELVGNLTGILGGYAQDSGARGLIHNSESGIIRVDSQLPRTENFNTFGIDGGPSLLNEGLIDVDTVGGRAFGVRSFEIASDRSIINRGTINVNGITEAYGVYLGNAVEGILNNSGSIDVYAEEFAVGVFDFNATSNNAITNSGSIVVSTNPSSSYASIGILLGNNGSAKLGSYQLFNSGTIDADIALISIIPNAGQESPIFLFNSGAINGLVQLASKNDLIVNSGNINGLIDLGEGNDTYLGQSGNHYGEIYAGGGEDLLIGGTGADIFFGQAGNDVILGGGGDDIIDGGPGSDALDGGLGFDFASFLFSLGGMKVDLAAGSALGAGESDKLVGFEGVIGTRFDDRLFGDANSNSIIGAGGDDVLDGRSGSDLVYGGTGNDRLTGGEGIDRFLFSRGDGYDRVTDFTNGEAIEIYGYGQAQSIKLIGSDVRVRLSTSDFVLVENSTIASVTAALSFSTSILDLGFDLVNDDSFASTTDFVLNEGADVALKDPFFIGQNLVNVKAGLILQSESGQPTPNFYNAGSFSLDYSGAQTAVAVTLGLTSGDRDHSVVNAASGNISVKTDSADAATIFAISYVFNQGDVNVESNSGNVTGISDANELIVNHGNITVVTNGSGSGIGQLPTTSDSTPLVFNSGSIAVHGGSLSTGTDVRAFSHPAAERYVLVNSGAITVTDNTAAIDSAGILFDTYGKLSIWNSGTITADYAIRRNELRSGAPTPSDDVAAIYNSGTLNGLVDLSRSNDTNIFGFLFVNSGQINGDVNLWSGSDYFDGREGILNGIIAGRSGNDVLLTGDGSQRLLGGSGNDLLSGGRHNDILTGGTGADIFRYQAKFGIDTITDFNAAEGDRVDVADYSAWQSIGQVGQNVVVTFNASNKIIFENRTLADVTIAHFNFGAANIAVKTIPDVPVAPDAPDFPSTDGASAEFFELATQNSDVVRGKNGVDDFLFGLAGNDVFRSGTGDAESSRADVMIGGTGDDIYFVEDATDVVGENIDEGNDEIRSSVDYALPTNVETLRLLGNATEATGNFLDNLLIGNNKSNLIKGLAGNDVIFGRAGADNLYGNDGNDVINGGDGNDLIFGDAGDDVINGAGGDDIMYGGLGNDSYTIHDAGDVIVENANEGIDSVNARIDYILPANVEILSLFGGARIGTGNALDNTIFGRGGRDTLSGLDGNDIIRGKDSPDNIDGGEGNDLIDGGEGKDIMTGGAGKDTFQFRFASDFNATRHTADVVTDFDQALNERIHLSAIDADTNTGAHDAFEWISTNAFSNTAGEMRYQQIAGDTFIEGDTDGDGQTDLMIRLIGLYTLDATDIIGVSDLQDNSAPASLSRLLGYTGLFDDSGLLSVSSGEMGDGMANAKGLSFSESPSAKLDTAFSDISSVSLTTISEDNLFSDVFSPEGPASFAVAPAAAFEGEGALPRLDPAALFDAPMPEPISLYVDNVI